MKELNRILRNVDATEGAVSADPLDTNVNDIDTNYPLLPDSHYMFRLTDCAKVPNKAGTGDNLVVKHSLIDAAQDIKGEPVNPGFVITSYVSLTETAGVNGKQPYTIDNIKKGVARIAKAAGVNATVRQIIDNPTILNGKAVRAKVTTSKETAEFPASNRINSYATE